MSDMSKLSDERYSPARVLDVVRKFDAIWLDPCTTAANITGARLFYTMEDNGLIRPWAVPGEAGLVWINSPYSRGSLRAWINKCVHESREGAEIIALIPSDLGSQAGALAANTADALCFVRGRLSFGSPDGQLPQGAKQPSVLVYWGERSKRFASVFAELGTVWRR